MTEESMNWNIKPGRMAFIVPIGEYGRVTAVYKDDTGQTIVKVVRDDGNMHFCRTHEVLPAPPKNIRHRILAGARLFELHPNGDPYSRAWDCHEYSVWFEHTDSCMFRGDLGHRFSRTGLRWYLRRNYRGCIIREAR
jgi:hypothetical protein